MSNFKSQEVEISLKIGITLVVNFNVMELGCLNYLRSMEAKR